MTPETATSSSGKCTPADPVAPAEKAGLQPGDRIVSFNGTEVDLLGPAVAA